MIVWGVAAFMVTIIGVVIMVSSVGETNRHVPDRRGLERGSYVAIVGALSGLLNVLFHALRMTS